MTKKNKIGIILGSVGLGAISVATPLIVTSCGSKSNNNNSQESIIKPVEVPSTDNITTFADALEFTKQFFAKNYTFDMFKNDFNNMVDKQNKEFDKMSNEITMNWSLNFTLDSNKKLNLSSTIIQKSKQKDVNDATIKANKFNFKVVPVLVKQPDGSVIAKIGFDDNWMGSLIVGQTTYKTLEELKQNEPNWENETIAQYIRDFDGEKSEQWVIEKWIINNSEIQTVDQRWLDCQSIKLIFNNIENQN
ncbi:MAG: hypothetical protein K2I49_00745 [Ureaplasma sp.]|nr:hypothetical protein [Ureaplasma sp.]